MIRPDQPNYDFLYDKGYYSRYFHINHCINKELTYKIIENSYVVPYSSKNEGGIFDSEGNYVKGSSFREGGGWLEREGRDNSETNLEAILHEQSLNSSRAVNNAQTVIYAGIMMSAWGHFITDSMRLLWFLQTKDYAEKFSGYPIVYLPGGGFKVAGNHKRMFEILGIDTSLLEPVTELAHYEKIILPEESFFMNSEGIRFFTPEYVKTIDSIRDFAASNVHPVKSSKIYFSYSRYKKGNTIGEDKLEKYFASKGYEVVYPEKHSLDEQLNMLVSCESFASTRGSCSHNMIFLRDNTEVIIVPRTNSLTGYNGAIDTVHRLNVNFVDSSFSIFAEAQWSGPFLFFISSNLRKYFHDDDTESIIDASDFWKYVRFIFGYRLGRSFGRTIGANNPGVYKYYSNIAAEYFGKLGKMSWPYRLRQFLKRILRRKK